MAGKLTNNQADALSRIQGRKAAGKGYNDTRLQILKGMNRGEIANPKLNSSIGREGDEGIQGMLPPNLSPFAPNVGGGPNPSPSPSPSLQFTPYAGDYQGTDLAQINPAFSPISDTQLGRLGRLERREEAGKNINAGRLQKLTDLSKQSNRFQKYMGKFPDQLQTMFGGPGQSMAGTNISGWYGGLSPADQQYVAGTAFANRQLGSVAGMNGALPNGGPATLGNYLNGVFPQLKQEYLGGLYGMSGADWGALTPMEQKRLRMQDGRGGTSAPAPAPAPAPIPAPIPTVPLPAPQPIPPTPGTGDYPPYMDPTAWSWFAPQWGA